MIMVLLVLANIILFFCDFVSWIYILFTQERKMQVACLLVLVVQAASVISGQLGGTYYQVEVHGNTIQCKKCSPGTFWTGKHCSHDGGQAICQDCQQGTFSEDYSIEYFCRRCKKCVELHEVVVEACTQNHDTKCGCKSGYRRTEGKAGDCRELCKPGYGVIKDSYANTTCERCGNGKTFSNITSQVTPCQKCSVCPEGLLQKNACNETEDTLCVPKDEVEEDSVGVILGVACGVILTIVTIGIITFCCWKKRNEFLQKLHTRWRKEKLDEEKQANQQQPFMAPQ
ncbi:tumor necrosis factor receptor superfamily member 1B-like isoform X2 [Mya arenaria]|uniref:tumor necrosis factor receptor superfamily member 1B-like isoform X2 n=1 Tax=Mya arenaria TaxID=6604 RepID=UPI0022E09DB2|nr:tumor necrosis factor receptor superfamily member 1B-like isoform X2 [Mya arenaria]